MINLQLEPVDDEDSDSTILGYTQHTPSERSSGNSAELQNVQQRCHEYDPTRENFQRATDGVDEWPGF